MCEWPSFAMPVTTQRLYENLLRWGVCHMWSARKLTPLQVLEGMLAFQIDATMRNHTCQMVGPLLALVRIDSFCSHRSTWVPGQLWMPEGMRLLSWRTLSCAFWGCVVLMLSQERFQSLGGRADAVSYFSGTYPNALCPSSGPFFSPGGQPTPPGPPASGSKPQSLDPFADLGDLGSGLQGKVQNMLDVWWHQAST